MNPLDAQRIYEVGRKIGLHLVVDRVRPGAGSCQPGFWFWKKGPGVSGDGVGVFFAGQVAFMLKEPPSHTWGLNPLWSKNG